MQIFRHFTANDVQLLPFPFKRELSMEAYLIENEGVLGLDNDTFSNVEIIEAELHLTNGRASNATHGRIDILATYSSEYIAIVELKLGQLVDIHLKQLEDYLLQTDQVLESYPDILDKSVGPPRWIGVLVGTSIESTLAEKLINGYQTASGVQIAALTIQRYRSEEGNVYVTTDTYFNGAVSLRDTRKYQFEGVKLGKGRLVLEVIKYYIEKHPLTTYSELEKTFPKTCQGSKYGVFDSLEIANSIASEGRTRHFLKPEDIIKLKDGPIAVCNQWGIGNIGKFIDAAINEKYKITEVNW